MAFAWVASHQDQHKKNEDHLNVEVEKLAQLALATGVGNEEYISSDFSFKDVQIRLGGTKASGFPRKAIVQHHTLAVAQELYYK